MHFIYQEYQPSPSLQPVVDCYYTIGTTGSRSDLSPPHRCLPLGMLELLIQLDDNFAHGEVCNQSYVFPRAYLVGADSVTVERDGKVRTLCIRKGVENMEYVEVLSGLDTTDVLVKK